MRGMCLCCIALALVVSGCATGAEITLCNWNVQNLFDSYDDPYHNDVDWDGDLQVKAEEEVTAIAKVLADIDADIVALQEIENRGVLESLVRNHLAESGYAVSLIEGNDGRGIDVAVLSKLPIDSSTSYRHRVFKTSAGDEERFSRDILRAVLRLPDGRKLSLYTCHLKSRSGGDASTRKRQAEASELRRIVDQDMAEGDLVVVCGDLNDDVASGTPTIVAGPEGSAKHLWPVPAKSSKDSDITWHGRYASRYPPIRFDYVFLSPALKAMYVKESGVVYTKEPAETAADHYPVVVRFKVK